MSLAELARGSGLSKGHISGLERGFARMNVATLLSTAAGLRAPPFLLLVFPDEPFGEAIERLRLEKRGDIEAIVASLRSLRSGGDPSA